MKNNLIVIIAFLIFVKCNSPIKEEQENTSYRLVTENLYDLFYMDFISKGKEPIILNIDSLNEIKDIGNHLKWFEANQSNLNISLTKINIEGVAVSPELKQKMKKYSLDKKNGIGIQHSFSKPFLSGEEKYLIFWESKFKKLSFISGVAYYSFYKNESFILDSIVTIHESSIK